MSFSRLFCPTITWTRDGGLEGTISVFFEIQTSLQRDILHPFTSIIQHFLEAEMRGFTLLNFFEINN